MYNTFAGLQCAGSTATLNLTTSALKFTAFSDANGGGGNLADDTYNAGDASIKPDKTNNQVECGIGTYKAIIGVHGSGASIVQVTAKLRKNSNAIAGCTGKATFAAASVKGQLCLVCVFTITAADLATAIGAATAVQTFADPTSAFAGKGGAPYNLVPVDFTLTGDASVTLTVDEAQFVVERIR